MDYLLTPSDAERSAIDAAGYGNSVDMLNLDSFNEFLKAFRSRWEPRGVIVPQDVPATWDEVIGF